MSKITKLINALKTVKDNSTQWLVGYTAPRAEKQVYAKLIGQGVQVYLPLAKSSRKWSDRIKIVEMPLFTSYIFLKIRESDIYSILSNTPGLVRFIFHDRKFAHISEKEIDNIKKFLEKTEGYQFSFEENQVVEIKDGVLKGKRGIITKLGKEQLQLRIEELGWVVTAKMLKTEVKAVSV